MHVLEKIEGHLSLAEKIRLRTCNRQVTGGYWWLWPRDRLGYMRWVIEVRKRDMDHVEEVFEQIRELI